MFSQQLNIKDKLDSISSSVDLSDQTILNNKTKKSLEDLKSSSVANINFTRFFEEVGVVSHITWKVSTNYGCLEQSATNINSLQRLLKASMHNTITQVVQRPSAFNCINLGYRYICITKTKVPLKPQNHLDGNIQRRYNGQVLNNVKSFLVISLHKAVVSINDLFYWWLPKYQIDRWINCNLVVFSLCGFWGKYYKK